MRAPTLNVVYHQCLSGESFVTGPCCLLRLQAAGTKGRLILAYAKGCSAPRGLSISHGGICRRAATGIIRIRGGRIPRRTPLLCSLATLRQDTGAGLKLATRRALGVTRGLCRKNCVSCPHAKYDCVARSVFRRIPSLVNLLGRRPHFA